MKRIILLTISLVLLTGAAHAANLTHLSDHDLCMKYVAATQPNEKHGAYSAKLLAEMERRSMNKTGSSLFQLIGPAGFVAMSKNKVFVGESAVAMTCTNLGQFYNQETVSTAQGEVRIYTYIIKSITDINTYTTVYVQGMQIVQVSHATQ